jgi:hypothetical protein
MVCQKGESRAIRNPCSSFDTGIYIHLIGIEKETADPWHVFEVLFDVGVHDCFEQRGKRESRTIRHH